MKDHTKDKASKASDIETGNVQPHTKKKHRVKIEMRKQPSSMSRFFYQVDTIHSNIEALKEATAEVSTLCDQAIHATTTKEENDISKELKLVVGKANKVAKHTKDLLCRLEQDTKTRKQKGKLKGSDERYVLFHECRTKCLNVKPSVTALTLIL